MLSTSVRWAFNIKKWVPSEHEFILANQCIQKEEKQRVNEFVFKNDVKSALVGRLLLRRFLTRHLGVPYDSLVLGRSDRGRPVLLDPQPRSPLDFNISHQGEYCVLAGDAQSAIGVDVMKLTHYTGGRDLEDYFRIMKRQFTECEWSFIEEKSTDKERMERFLRLWCLKESYLKAIGCGITDIQETLSFRCRTPDLEMGATVTDSMLYLNCSLSPWVFHESLLDPLHCVVVALQQRISL
ncbi:AASDHPPT [Cordylochernes scorpioides]|uniref:L-aminoadipate-semialdehyde dehydrogenase-phosphopantetheinyl transferase n=1 Tax=Cordylochernes scorpioides TaxID=51811 RepID=A0ABY6KFD1_9ARAC|nr:AASDHPPT [Cordylochernes scorpioides]